MPTMKEVLDGKVGLDIRSVDRVLLNGWVRYLQMPGGLASFIRQQRGWPIPSPAMLGQMTDSFRKAVERFADEQGLKIVTFEKGDDKQEIAQAHLARFTGTSGVVLIGKAQEQTSAFRSRREVQGTRVWFTYSRQSVRVTHYYFYVLDVSTPV